LFLDSLQFAPSRLFAVYALYRSLKAVTHSVCSVGLRAIRWAKCLCNWRLINQTSVHLNGPHAIRSQVLLEDVDALVELRQRLGTVDQERGQYRVAET
jgi:hypothetical protein